MGLTHIGVLMAHRVRSPSIGAVGRDVLPYYRIAVFVHHEHVDRARTSTFVDALVFDIDVPLFV